MAAKSNPDRLGMLGIFHQFPRPMLSRHELWPSLSHGLSPNSLADRIASCDTSLVQPLADHELERLASEGGPASKAALALAELRALRARDEQVFAYQLGDLIVVIPEPTSEERMRLLLAYEASKHMKGR